ncbi:GD23956 [Drosophila simulans]|uniref:GD23956 n=1 Tax=Drosophila simulans TaxID=7240 RepID=B4Q5I1_DROSI|nr:GD23956 [Drosophila simulans]
MQIGNFIKWPLGLILILLVTHCQAKRQRKRLRGFSTAKDLQDYSLPLNDNSTELQQNIVSWTGARIASSPDKKKKSPQSSRRHKTKSGLIIESNIADSESMLANASSESVTKKKPPQRRRNGKLQKSGGGGGAGALRLLKTDELYSSSFSGGLYPPLFNVVPRAQISVNATCGQNGAEEYCIKVGAKPCGICNAHSSDRA